MNILDGRAVTCPLCGTETQVVSWSVESRVVPGSDSVTAAFKQYEADPNTQIVRFLCGDVITEEFARWWVDGQAAETTPWPVIERAADPAIQAGEEPK